MNGKKITVENIKPHIGARILLDKSVLCDDDVVKQINQLVEDRGVVVFPRLGLTDEEQLAFTDSLGANVHFLNREKDESADGIYEVTLDPEINDDPSLVKGTFFWHMDGILIGGVAPPKFTLLSAHKIAGKGGQTEFASTKAGYENLPASEKADIENLRVVHSVHSAVRGILALDEEWTGSPNTNELPLVWKKASGDRSLVIGYTADYVVDMPIEVGRALLARLQEWVAQPDFSLRHEWQEGDFVIWDNCGTVHRAIPYAADSGRNMHRTSVAGVELVE